MSGIKDLFAASNSATVSKLVIKGYKLSDHKDEGGQTTGVSVDGESSDEFVAYYNPTSFSSKLGIEYQPDMTIGDTKISALFSKYATTTYSFSLLIDGTGASIPSGWKDKGPKPKDFTFVNKQINKFKSVAYDLVGDTHRPNYLSLFWGGTNAPKCVLTSLGITFDLFAPTGDPLRATLACEFQEYSTKVVEKAKLESPDMTHIRVVQQGDRLPLMCEGIYGDAGLYLEVARYNGILNYRHLTPGQKLIFPPLVASKS